MVKLLLNFGGRDLVMLRQHNGTSCLFKAAARGHVAVVDLLIDVGGRELIMMENYATVRYGTRLGDLKESCFELSSYRSYALQQNSRCAHRGILLDSRPHLTSL